MENRKEVKILACNFTITKKYILWQITEFLVFGRMQTV